MRGWIEDSGRRQDADHLPVFQGTSYTRFDCTRFTQISPQWTPFPIHKSKRKVQDSIKIHIRRP